MPLCWSSYACIINLTALVEVRASKSARATSMRRPCLLRGQSLHVLNQSRMCCKQTNFNFASFPPLIQTHLSLHTKHKDIFSTSFRHIQCATKRATRNLNMQNTMQLLWAGFDFSSTHSVTDKLAKFAKDRSLVTFFGQWLATHWHMFVAWCIHSLHAFFEYLKQPRT